MHNSSQGELSGYYLGSYLDLNERYPSCLFSIYHIPVLVILSRHNVAHLSFSYLMQLMTYLSAVICGLMSLKLNVSIAFNTKKTRFWHTDPFFFF